MKKHLLMASAAVLVLGLATPAFATDPVVYNNDSKIEQVGDLNGAVALQGGEGTNKSTITQGSTTEGTESDGSVAWVQQDGSVASTSTITQTGDGQIAYVRQTGGGTNESTITQGNGLRDGATGANEAYVVQGAQVDLTSIEGGLPPVYEMGEATARNNTSTIAQSGSGNRAGVNQY